MPDEKTGRIGFNTRLARGVCETQGYLYQPLPSWTLMGPDGMEKRGKQVAGNANPAGRAF